MVRGTLYLSFWDICLDNLPQGSFRRQSITLVDAKHLIETARKENALCCLSREDLLAPYNQDERNRYEEMSAVLRTHSKIKIYVKDFLSKHETEEGPLYCTKPLQGMHLREQDHLLVITCAYGMKRKSRKSPLNFKIEPSTIAFHLIEATKISAVSRDSSLCGVHHEPSTQTASQSAAHVY